MKGGLNMIENKKGLSEVVTTLIIILLVLVAIGIVWVVVNNVLQSGTEQAELSAKCLNVDIKATAVSCVAGTCSVTYKRNSGTDAVSGIIIVLSNGTESAQKQVAGNINISATKTETGFVTGLTNVNKAEIAAYFTAASGENQTCPTPSSFEFV